MTDETQKISILIVDDDTLYLDVLRELLQDTYDIRVAQTGSSAIVIAEDTQPDIILLDVVIPGMTGYEVFSALQENETTRHIPIIFISGLTDVEEQEKGILLGAADYIQKPCSKIVLHAKVNMQLKLVEYAHMINQIGMLDPLTGLPLRKRFAYRVHEEWRRNCRSQTPISLICVDIDNFKGFNQEYGYVLGDDALKMIAEVCKSAVRRPSDILSMLGNGAFGILLPATDILGAEKIATDILENVRKQGIKPLNEGKRVKLTVSIGIAVLTPQKNDLLGNVKETIDEFMNRAFEKLQEAKDSGKDRIAL